MTFDAQENAADQNRDEVPKKLHQDQLCKALIAVQTAEIRDEHALFPDTVKIAVKDKNRRDGKCADAANAVGDKRRQQQKNPVADHS